ncbi:hypothetical protein [uncultured Desulfobacter sp.]|uniref:hypothetical protein n=1 Tax=uncultured Desulfobacter sp. TaxID=240139 RepID=UPI002AA81D6E|nr:hypothetical protein [uncultured Desulfobacter sp.]
MYSTLNNFLLIAENDIKFFHKTKDEADSYKRVLKSFFNKNVFQQCVDELEIAHGRLSKDYSNFAKFYQENKQKFTADTKKHIISYLDYLKSAVLAAEKRLFIQRVILDIKINRTVKKNEVALPKMFNELDEMYGECRQKAILVNNIAEEIKSAYQGYCSRRKKPRG